MTHLSSIDDMGWIRKIEVAVSRSFCDKSDTTLQSQTSKATLFLEVSFFNPQKQTNQTPNLRREPTGRLGNVVHSPWEKEP